MNLFVNPYCNLLPYMDTKEVSLDLKRICSQLYCDLSNICLDFEPFITNTSHQIGALQNSLTAPRIPDCSKLETSDIIIKLMDIMLRWWCRGMQLWDENYVSIP